MFNINNLAMAANYTVGAPNGGWDRATNLAAWASSISFIPGDNLLFEYTLNHDVTEVTQADFDSCNPNNPLQPPLRGGSSVITLSAPGSRYFICGTAGHCLAGMKLEIDTLAASAPPPAAPPTVLPPPPMTAPSALSPAAAPSAGLRPVSSPPAGSMVPSPSPSSSSPPPKAAASGPVSPPAAAPPPRDSLLTPPPAPSSGRNIRCYGYSHSFFWFCRGYVELLRCLMGRTMYVFKFDFKKKKKKRIYDFFFS
ncbi:blue copper protein [Phtheirospermum japonicum]|uniref:Blue copper protein n=1 Tax=Phtheirospermum japonicum TaxID=374723 RepID=A0A830BBU7_9LAMI|nr:blue copper protein [Phtheirospermum japonicum]